MMNPEHSNLPVIIITQYSWLYFSLFKKHNAAFFIAWHDTTGCCYKEAPSRGDDIPTTTRWAQKSTLNVANFLTNIVL